MYRIFISWYSKILSFKFDIFMFRMDYKNSWNILGFILNVRRTHKNQFCGISHLLLFTKMPTTFIYISHIQSYINIFLFKSDIKYHQQIVLPRLLYRFFITILYFYYPIFLSNERSKIWTSHAMASGFFASNIKSGNASSHLILSVSKNWKWYQDFIL